MTAEHLLCSPQYLVNVPDAVQASSITSPIQAVSECSYELSLIAEHGSDSDSDSDQAASQQPARDMSLEAGHSVGLICDDGNVQQLEF